ncbi:MAG: class I SAM-dependent methyltransferase [Candidatus Heimdallarchaeota archaeon]|nr:class I SAM-dependent methyltransferase [Candidatus Heimdallarchaeota archaeon]
MTLKWRYLQNANAMDVGRYFEYDEDALNLFAKWLFFLKKPKIKVLEIGSGSGYFTRLLLKLFPEIELTCLEYDEALVKTLYDNFNKKITIINETIEGTTIRSDSFDAVISHIVIHNLEDPLKGIIQMARVAKLGGQVVTIEPLPASRHYYPDSEIEAAFDLLDKVQMYKCIEWSTKNNVTTKGNPWEYCYPKFFEEVGLKNINSFGWTSIFTLSDERFDFNEKKKWIKMRYDLIKSKEDETTNILLAADVKEIGIKKAHEVIYNYFEKLLKVSKEQITHIHEQEIVHRIITIGTKK